MNVIMIMEFRFKVNVFGQQTLDDDENSFLEQKSMANVASIVSVVHLPNGFNAQTTPTSSNLTEEADFDSLARGLDDFRS